MRKHLLIGYGMTGGMGERGISACRVSPRSAVVNQKAQDAHNIQIMAGNTPLNKLKAYPSWERIVI